MRSSHFNGLVTALLAVATATAAAAATGCNSREVTYSDPCAAGPRGGEVWGCWEGQAHDFVTIDVPTGALDRVVRFTVVPYQGTAPAGVVPGTAFSIVTDPPVEFAQPIRLTIRFDPAWPLLPRPGHTEWLRLVQFEQDATTFAATWRSTVDETLGLVRGETTHLSIYAIGDLKAAEATLTVASPPQSKVDVLFMIDNSNSMDPKQTSLMQYFPKFMERLVDMTPPLDMHLGIVTSDLGAGQFTPPSCDTPGGDKGVLQNTPKGSTCAGAQLVDPNDRFLRYAPDPAGGAPTTNFTGTISDAFSCYAAVGPGGCGFEHQLASVRAAFDTAFDPCHPGTSCTAELNAGFLRPDAALAIVLLTDEDDCSAPANTTLFDPTQTTLGSELGPLSSYRCFQFGSLCDGADPGRDPGSRLNCEVGTFQPDKPEHQLSPVEGFAAFFKGLKSDARMVSVSVLAGPAAPIVVGTDDATGYPMLEPACSGAMGSALPALRLNKLTTLFDGDRAQFTSVCADDLAPAMDQVGSLVNTASVVAWCLDFAPVDFDPAPGLQVDCRVNATDAGDLERCDVASLDASCYVVRETAGCAGGAMLQLYRGTGLTEFGYLVSLECATVAPR
jgi:hypothetical protein